MQMLTTAVSDMARAMSSSPKHPNTRDQTPVLGSSRESAAALGISPCKIANLRTNYLQQMRELHSLFENGALDDKEFQEQKVPILLQLKKLSQC